MIYYSFIHVAASDGVVQKVRGGKINDNRRQKHPECKNMGRSTQKVRNTSRQKYWQGPDFYRKEL